MKLFYILLLLFVPGSKCKLHEFEYTEGDTTHLLVLDSEDADLSCSKPADLLPATGYLSWEKSVLVPEAGNGYHKIDEINSITPLGGNADENKMAARFEGEFSKDDPSRYQFVLYLPSNTTEPRDGKYTCFFNPTTDEFGSDRYEVKVYYVRVIFKEPNQTSTYDYSPSAPDIALDCIQTCRTADQENFTTRWFYFPIRLNAPSRDYGLHSSFDHVKREHKSSSAVYYCLNEEFQYTKMTIVNIMYLPDVYMTPTAEIYKSEGDPLRLVCLIDSYPLADISWSGNDYVKKAKRNDSPLMVDDCFDTKSKFLPQWLSIRKSILEIESLKADSFGKYICSACNSLGCSNNTITVKRTITDKKNRKH